jgi:hypothetical protein
VLSDGRSEEGDYFGLARQARDAGMTVTTVAVGEDADMQTMQTIAEIGNGRFYAADRAENLPRIFTREAFLASRSTIIEEPFSPRLVRPTQATDGIDWAGAPQLGGYVGTAERDTLKSPAITSLVSDKDDPVYAVWQYGLGRAAAFTSDAKPRWAAGWMNWSGFGQFWTQVLRDTLRRDVAGDLVPRVEINAGRGHVVVEALTPDGAFKNNLRLRARVIAPDLTATEITLEQTAAGRYEADFDAVAQGSYIVSVNEEGNRPAPATGAVNSYSPEFSITGADVDLLARVSELTGGQVLPDPSDATGTVNLFDRRATRTRPHEIWEALILVALLLLPVDVGVRRVNITREQVEEAREWVASKLRPPAQTEAEAESAASLAQLKGARSRVRLGDRAAKPGATGIDSGESTPRAPLITGPGPIRSRSDDERPGRPPAAARAETESLPASAETGEARPLASRLLDARRKKREG